MLKTPNLHTSRHGNLHEIFDAIAAANGNLGREREIEPGFIEIGHFNLNNMLMGNRKFYQDYPDLDILIDIKRVDYEGKKPLNCYGVCDSPEQFIGRFKQALMDDPRTFCVSFTHMRKDPSNAGEGGGWRWHKWGPYIGTGEPTMEYLDDEEHFDNGVYIYHVLQLDGPHLVREYPANKMVPGNGDF